MFSDSDKSKKFAYCQLKYAYIIQFGLAPHIHALNFKCFIEFDNFTLLFGETLNRKIQIKQLEIHICFLELKKKTKLGHST